MFLADTDRRYRPMPDKSAFYARCYHILREETRVSPYYRKLYSLETIQKSSCKPEFPFCFSANRFLVRRRRQRQLHVQSDDREQGRLLPVPDFSPSTALRAASTVFEADFSHTALCLDGPIHVVMSREHRPAIPSVLAAP